VLDTNIIISAFLTPTGNPAHILRMVLTHELDVCYNTAIFTEYTNVATREKFAKHIDPKQVQQFLAILKSIGIFWVPTRSSLPFVDETDRIFYDTAKSSDSFLVTGIIRHFPQEPFIMTPASFVNFAAAA
jgi:putative PIN family toxin of toxin-antitoxin system